MQRAIDTIFPAERVIDDGDMLLWRALPLHNRSSLGPFVFIDHYRHRSRRGIGDSPHPHAGIEVISYLLEGSVEHRDSLGFKDRLGPGDAQWIRAGRGMLHAEQPAGGRHGLQLWTSLPPADKLAEPAYASFRAADIPEIQHVGVLIRVIAGSLEGVAGPMKTTSPTLFVHINLDPGASVTLPVNATFELGLYVLDGRLEGDTGAQVGPGALAVLTSGSEITLQAVPDQRTDVALLGGAPIEGAILFSGPFVMDIPERLVQAKRDFASGAMGRLEGVPF
ncbi:pirin family protein [Candidatus Nitrotoga arctica]|uniref:Pirin-like protein CC_3178 n=1 Tax=Candidatus Nitrotoga arctica TaxID=453162 RepID=A0ABN8ARG6_9PROT|nr:pirin family protein [Candidatus Nitrotoga arctica]CAG9933310.1 putative Pirin-like protein CC_3178 [Candidatus Nitrotoga arctica]